VRGEQDTEGGTLSDAIKLSLYGATLLGLIGVGLWFGRRKRPPATS
jgi:hypothetical protein